MNMKNLIKEWASIVINESSSYQNDENVKCESKSNQDVFVSLDELIKELQSKSESLKSDVEVVAKDNKLILYGNTGMSNVNFEELPSANTVDESNESSEDYAKAKKIGYMGSEENVAEWLKGDYAKWKQHCLDVFMRLANGDEEKAMKWFETYDRLSHSMYGTRFGTDHGYVDSEDVKKELAAELGNDEEASELIKKIDDKWKSDAKSLSDFYASSSSRGGWTGD